METVTVPKDEFEKLIKELRLLRNLFKNKMSEIDWDLVRQFDESLEDLKQGRFKRLA